jgi:predicted DNA-binding transcriptional regulator YafY
MPNSLSSPRRDEVQAKVHATWFVRARSYDRSHIAFLNSDVPKHPAMPTPSDPRDTIAYRLTEILRRLNEGEALDPHALVEEFGVNLRTIQRDLNQRFAFLDLVKKDGRYTIDRSRLGTLTLHDVQRFASLAGLQGLHPRLSTGFLRDILDTRLQSALLIRGHNYEDLHNKESEFNQLKQAAQQHRVVSFEYRKPDSTAAKLVDDIRPYKLVNQDGIWYLAATDAGKPKSYAVSRIERLLVLADTFTPDPAVLQQIANEDSVWLKTQKTEVVLKVARPAASYFQQRKLISGQNIEKKLEDGGLIVSGIIAHPNQILPIVRQWIPHIRVISPEGLQDELENQLKDYLGIALPN